MRSFLHEPCRFQQSATAKAPQGKPAVAQIHELRENDRPYNMPQDRGFASSVDEKGGVRTRIPARMDAGRIPVPEGMRRSFDIADPSGKSAGTGQDSACETHAALAEKRAMPSAADKRSSGKLEAKIVKALVRLGSKSRKLKDIFKTRRRARRPACGCGQARRRDIAFRMLRTGCSRRHDASTPCNVREPFPEPSRGQVPN